ncbi:manganese-dependent inorganic pyrophosphatase [Vibrio sp. JCM 19236]|nr:manganese-dependent inorganic pyrophosphatase [Vibrio sp. JCM 19236]
MPIRQGEINRETQHILEQAGLEQPEFRTSVAGEKFGLLTTAIWLKHQTTSTKLRF